MTHFFIFYKKVIMKHCVVWSGGLDSTFILCDLIKKGYDVSVLIFKSNNFGEEKLKYEERSRLNIEKYLGKKILSQYINLEFDGFDVIGPDPGLFQQPFMISNISLMGEKDTVYYLGYHKGDDFFSCSSEIMKASESILKVCGNKNLKFDFPLKFWTKEHIVNACDEMGITKLCHFCEYPENDSSMNGMCGKCVPCQTYKDALDISDIHKRNGIRKIAIPSYSYLEENNKSEVVSVEQKIDSTVTEKFFE